MTLCSRTHLSASLLSILFSFFYYLSQCTNAAKGAAPRPPCNRFSRSHACKPADCGLFSFFAVQSRCRLRATAPPPSLSYLAEFQNISRHVHVYVVSVAASQKGVTAARGRGGVGVEGWKRERERWRWGGGLFVRDECRCSIKGVLWRIILPGLLGLSVLVLLWVVLCHKQANITAADVSSQREVC